MFTTSLAYSLQEPFQNGQLFIKGIPTPSAIHNEISPVGEYQTLATVEILKFLKTQTISLQETTVIGEDKELNTATGFGFIHDRTNTEEKEADTIALKHFDFIYFEESSEYAKKIPDQLFDFTSALIEAIFLRIEYKKLTGITLPILQKYSKFNLAKIPESFYTEENILLLWEKVLTRVQITKSVRYLQNTFKTVALYGASKTLEIAKDTMMSGPADSNYSEKLQNKINFHILSTAYGKAKATPSVCHHFLTNLNGYSQHFIETLWLTDPSEISNDVKDRLMRLFIKNRKIAPTTMDNPPLSEHNRLHFIKSYLRHGINVDFQDICQPCSPDVGTYLIAKKYDMADLILMIQDQATEKVKDIIDDLNSNYDAKIFYQDLLEIAYFICHFDILENVKNEIPLIEKELAQCIKSKNLQLKPFLFYLNHLIQFGILRPAFVNELFTDKINLISNATIEYLSHLQPITLLNLKPQLKFPNHFFGYDERNNGQQIDFLLGRKQEHEPEIFLKNNNDSYLTKLCKKKNINHAVFYTPTNARTLDEHIDWAFNAIYSRDFSQQSPSRDSIKRLKHGISHTTRVAIYVKVFANLFKEFGIGQLSESELKLTQLAAVFHDAGREADGEDLWDLDSAVLFYLYAVKVARLEPKQIIPYVECIANKDANKDKPFYKWSEYDLDTGPKWEEVPFKSDYITLPIMALHDADCLDILRVKFDFKVEYLYFYSLLKLSLGAHANRPAFEKLAIVLRQAQSLLVSQGDSNVNRSIDIKIIYENGNCLAETNKLINKLSYFGETLEEKIDKSHYTENELVLESQYQEHLISGDLFARAVAVPSAIHTKLGPNGEYETLAACEIRKTLRRPGVATRTLKNDNKTKNGNPNRAVSLLGWGGEMYAGVGFGFVINSDSRIKAGAIGNLASGNGKRNNLKLEVLTIPERLQLIQDIQDKLKMFAYVSKQGNIVYKHTEFTADIDHFSFILFQHSPNYYDTNKLQHPTRISQYAPFLQAYFLHIEYQKKAGIVLPIFKYYPEHNKIELMPKALLTQDSIIKTWEKMLEDFQSYSYQYFPYPLGSVSLDGYKTFAMYAQTNAVFTFMQRLASADSNYPDEMQNAINFHILNIGSRKLRTSNFISHFVFLNYLENFSALAMWLIAEKDMPQRIKDQVDDEYITIKFNQANEKITIPDWNECILFNVLQNYKRHGTNVDYLDTFCLSDANVAMYLLAKRFNMKKSYEMLGWKMKNQTESWIDALYSMAIYPVKSDEFYKQLKRIAFTCIFFDLTEKIPSALLKLEIALFKFMANIDKPVNKILYYLNHFVQLGIIKPQFARVLAQSYQSNANVVGENPHVNHPSKLEPIKPTKLGSRFEFFYTPSMDQGVLSVSVRAEKSAPH